MAGGVSVGIVNHQKHSALKREGRQINRMPPSRYCELWNQKEYLSANCITRCPYFVVIMPFQLPDCETKDLLSVVCNLIVMGSLLAKPDNGWLRKLKAEARNCSACDSVMWKVL